MSRKCWPVVDEEWRDIPGYEGCYQVSSIGRVRSLDRRARRRHHSGRQFECQLRGRVLSLQYGGTGYLQVALGRGNIRMVHRLVALAFIGPVPPGHEVRHRNGDKTDNSLANLAYATHVENELDKRAHGTHHLGSKSCCIRGHKLIDPNLVEFQKRRDYGYRQCKACYNAIAWRLSRRKRGEFISDEHLQKYADACYRRIMEGTSGRGASLHERTSWLG